MTLKEKVKKYSHTAIKAASYLLVQTLVVIDGLIALLATALCASVGVKMPNHDSLKEAWLDIKQMTQDSWVDTHDTFWR